MGQRVAARVHAGEPVHEALNAFAVPGGMSFVPQSALPDGMAYEAFIFETRSVPTRDHLHDFFNGLAWLRFPQTKARLNALQYAELQKVGTQPVRTKANASLQGAVRGPVRDALTLFDENAALLCSQWHVDVIAALHKHDWPTAFQTHRALLAEHPPVLFGHALLEKLVSPYKSITAHVFPVKLAAQSGVSHSILSDLEALDAAVAAQLSPEALMPKPFAPLPVLGVPRWWRANEAADFYTDRTVFRPPRP